MKKRGFTLLELLIVMGIIGILLALALPAVSAARGVANRMRCTNNLKQLGMSVHNYHESWGLLPGISMGRFVSSSESRRGDITDRYSVFAVLLPYMNESLTYDSININLSSYRGPGRDANLTVSQVRLSMFLCPSQPGTGFLSYGINTGRWSDDHLGVGKQNPRQGRTFSEITGGLSKTALFSERVWGHNYGSHPANAGHLYPFSLFPYQVDRIYDCKGLPPSVPGLNMGSLSWLPSRYNDKYDHGRAINSLVCLQTRRSSTASFPASSFHNGGVNVALCDGSVSFIKETISRQIWESLGTRTED